MTTLYIPTWSGDYRLEPLTGDDNAKWSRLTVNDPTPAEKARIRAFLEEARSKNWIDSMDGVMPKGETRLTVKARVAEAGRLLVSKAFEGDNRERWLAVRSVSGRVRVEIDETNVTALAATEASETEAAAVVRAPNRGCPPPVPCNRRAAEVLRAFTTRDQFDEWQATGTLLVTGNVTGRKYRLYHRDEAARRGLGHTLLTAEGAEVCVWDDTVPAEEEALGILIAVQYNESYIVANGGTVEGGLLDDSNMRRGRLVNGNPTWRRPSKWKHRA